MNALIEGSRAIDEDKDGAYVRRGLTWKEESQPET